MKMGWGRVGLYGREGMDEGGKGRALGPFQGECGAGLGISDSCSTQDRCLCVLVIQSRLLYDFRCGCFVWCSKKN